MARGQGCGNWDILRCCYIWTKCELLWVLVKWSFVFFLVCPSFHWKHHKWLWWDLNLQLFSSRVFSADVFLILVSYFCRLESNFFNTYISKVNAWIKLCFFYDHKTWKYNCLLQCYNISESLTSAKTTHTVPTSFPGALMLLLDL